MTKSLKLKLLAYLAVSAMSYSYLVMPERAGISVVLFAIIQAVFLWFTVPNRKRLILFIPVLIMSVNCFISGSNIWRISNVFVSAALYSCMFMPIDIMDDSMECFSRAIARMIEPIARFPLPFKWILELNSEKAPTIKRFAKAILITVPCVLILTLVLSSADMVFSLKTTGLLSDIFKFIRPWNIVILLAGIFAGLYMFGSVCNSYMYSDRIRPLKKNKKGYFIIINILLFAVLIVYTLFVIIQFKYLFAGSALPEGLTYTSYARKGFFELLMLTGVNITTILIVVKLTKKSDSKWKYFTKFLCHYLCAVTVVLLISSFYKMTLYTNDDGLTRLRFFVMGFLIFEAIGLLATFVYIAKPRFNIVLVYTLIALVYYIILNIIPSDNIIAKNQIDKFLKGEREGLHYIFTLSSDAAPAMEYLYENTDDYLVKDMVVKFVEDKSTLDIPDRWQRFNLSLKRAENITENCR